MKKINTKKILLWNFFPFYICCALIYVPYFFFERSDLFSIRLKFSNAEHAILGLVPVAIVALAAYLGGTRRKLADMRVIGTITTPAAFRLFLWSVFCFSIAFQTVQNALALGGFVSGGFTEARESQLFSGVGIFLRLDMIALPLLAATVKRKRLVLLALAAMCVSHLLTAIVLSQRTAINDAIYTAWLTLPLCAIYGLKTSRLIAVVSAIALAFSLLLSARLEQQSTVGGKFDSSSTTFLGSISAYYADTMNKYYLILSGDFDYPSIQAIIPITALVSSKAQANVGYLDVLTSQGDASGSLSTALNNPGGLAQDFSDFGNFAFLIVFFKFFVLAYCWFNRYKNLFFVAVGPFVIATVLEYPRFNYISFPFAFYLFILALTLGGFASMVSTRKNLLVKTPMAA